MNTLLNDKSIGFIGLGEMGHAMASRLRASVATLCVYDINTAASSSLKSTNTTVAEHPAQVGEQCDVVLMCLPDENASNTVLFGNMGLLTSQSVKATVIVDTSTLDVERTQSIALQVKANSLAEYCDCPVTGLPARAKTGELTAMFGGSMASYDQVEAYIALMAQNILHCGDVGQGQLTKAFNNVIYDINIAAFCELLPLAVKSGLDPSMLEKVLTSGSGSSFASEHFIPRILERKFSDDFTLQAAYKDIVNVNKAKNNVNANTPLFDAMQTQYEKSLAAGHGAEPKSALIKLYEQALGVTVTR